MNALRPRGYLYIATGKKYIDEAIISARSLRTVFPKADITLICDQRVDTNVFDEIQIHPYSAKNKKEGYLYKVRNMYEHSPYEKTFFIDSDTYFLDDCQELFDLLDYFDICIAQAPNDDYLLEINGEKILGYYSYNTGVIVFRRSKQNAELFAAWNDRYDIEIHDQPLFMKALLKTSPKVYVFPNIYNARTPGILSLMPAAVKIIHGRHNNYKAVAKNINKKLINRAWIPAEEDVLLNEKQLARMKSRSWRSRLYHNLPGPLQKRIREILHR